ncbi:hypothetical protein B0H11DRAFT_2361403 [Mycena galericulata]|nr:hypothetical protein B0H11DRAFT_2361403 [Mycena galericulata]
MYPRLCGTQFELWIIGLSAILPVASNSCIWVWIQYNLTSRTYINIWALGDYWIGVPSPFGVPAERSWNNLNHNRREGRPPDDNHSCDIPAPSLDHFDLFPFGFWGHRVRGLASCDLRLGIEVVAWQAVILFWALGALRSWPGKLRPPFGSWGH